MLLSLRGQLVAGLHDPNQGVLVIPQRHGGGFAMVCMAASMMAGCTRDLGDHDAPAAEVREVRGTSGSEDVPQGPVQIAMRRVRLRLGQGIFLDVDTLQGHMISRRSGVAPVFDDQDSYTLAVETAELSMGAASVAALLNHRVFAREGASLDDLELRTVGRQLEVRGDLNTGIDIPFTMRATVSPAGGTRLRLRPTSLKTAGVPVRGLLKFFGIELDDLIDIDRSLGLSVSHDDLLLDAAAALPPPRIRGEIAAVRVVDGRLAMSIRKTAPGAIAPLPPPPRPDANYIYFSGSAIRFGKLTMHDADLQLMDADPSDPFDFYPQQYAKQLIAGYSKNQPDGGLLTIMPDYDQADDVELPGAATRKPEVRPAR